MDSTHQSPYQAITDNGLVQIAKRPTTVCRLISLLFAVIVFGCITSAGYDPIFHHCVFNKNQDACHYGVAVGVLAFLACIFFIAVDYQYARINNGRLRKQLVSADLIFSIIWAFLWFAGFCFLADQWRMSNIRSQRQTNYARAVIAFSFFSIFTWTTSGLMALQRYRQGADFHNGGYDSIGSNVHEYQGGGGYRSASDFANSPYASFPQPSEDVRSAPPMYQPVPQYSEPDVPFGVPPPLHHTTPPPVTTDYGIPDY